MGLRSPVVVLAAAVVLSLSAGIAHAQGPMPADVVVTNARIYTARPQRDMAEALAIKDGDIAFVGSAADAKAWVGPHTQLVRLNGKLALPGLFDSHVHPIEIIDADVCNHALNAQQSISIRDVIDAYTISGARFLGRDREAGSLEVGKSGDFIVLNQDILDLADAGRADDIRNTDVLETWFMGKRIYVSNVRKSTAKRGLTK